MRYPVVWCEHSGLTYAGSLTLGLTVMTLDGVVGGDRSVIELPYGELAHVEMVSVPGQRVSGRPTLLVESSSGRSFRIAAVAGAGVMGEVADALTREMSVA